MSCAKQALRYGPVATDDAYEEETAGSRRRVMVADAYEPHFKAVSEVGRTLSVIQLASVLVHERLKRYIESLD